MVDQGVVSLANFLTVLLIARHLPTKSEFGVFGMLMDGIYYLNTIQYALAIYPMTIRGAGLDRKAFGSLATMSLAVSAVYLLLISGATLTFGSMTPYFAVALSALGALVMWQMHEALRRALMVHLRHREAVFGDAVAYCGIYGGVLFLGFEQNVTLVNIYIVMSLGFIAGTIVHAIFVGVRWFPISKLPGAVTEFFALGRWVMLSNFSALAVAISGPYTLTYFHGADVTGQLYAAAAMLKLSNPFISTISGLIVNECARAIAKHGFISAKDLAGKFVIVGFLIQIPYWLVLVFLPEFMMKLFLRGDSHFITEQGITALQWMVACYATVYFTGTGMAALNGLHESRRAFYAQLVGVVATLVIMLPMTMTLGLMGQLYAGVAVGTLHTAAILYFLRRAERDPVFDTSPAPESSIL
jgi:O-antigen/teichoic acid export membrane protein